MTAVTKQFSTWINKALHSYCLTQAAKGGERKEKGELGQTQEERARAVFT